MIVSNILDSGDSNDTSVSMDWLIDLVPYNIGYKIIMIDCINIVYSIEKQVPTNTDFPSKLIMS